MRLLPLKFAPGVDLRRALEGVLAGQGMQAGYVIQAIGSLSRAGLRLAGQDALTELHGDLEILSLGGSLSPDGVHLHIALADGEGRVTGGHMGHGCVVRTTAEVLVSLLPEYRFSREMDAATGYKELVIRPAPSAGT